MSTSRRPGGLTVFAIFNFFWALTIGLSTLAHIFIFVSGKQPPAALEALSQSEYLTLIVATGIQTTLLVISGIGYLKLHRFFGFWTGLVCAAVSIGVVFLSFSFVGRLDTNELIGVIYAPLSILVLAFPFRRDFFPDHSSLDQAELNELSGKVLEHASDGQPLACKHPMRLLATTGARFGLRRGEGATLILLTLLVGVYSAGGLIELMTSSLPEQMQSESGEFLNEALQSKQLRSSIANWTGSSAEQVSYLTKSQPAVLSGLFILLLMFVPFISMGGAFNLYAGDIKSKGLRFLLLRTERQHIFFGRLLSVVLYSALSFLVLVIMVTAYVQWNLKVYDVGSLWSWALQGYAALVICALPYLALCAIVSVRVASPTWALFGSLGVIVLPIFVIKIIQSTVGIGTSVDMEWALKLIPWGWRNDLLHGEPMTRLVAIGAMLLFAACFLVIGLRSFKKRDL